jgi:hypothetical protein
VALSCVVYRSRATGPFSRTDLLELTRAAQRRNRAESITGLVMFDEARFFQWLEGPADSLDRVMRSINADGRHTDVQVLAHQRTRVRSFSDWDMKLALRGAASLGRAGEVLDPPPEATVALRRFPEAAGDWLGRLAPLAPGRSALIEAVLRDRVIPELLARHRADAPARAPVHPRARELASLLLAGDPGPASALLAALAEAPGGDPLRRSLLEPAARRLGDLWAEDDCTDFDVTLALWRLEAALRLDVEPPRPRRPSRAALVVAHPGEPHAVGATIAAASLRRAGWDVTHELPADDDALAALLSAHRYDALDLSLSPALPRADRLPALARTVALARRASRHPGIAVAVGGRLFAEGGATPASVGADLTSHALPRPH